MIKYCKELNIKLEPINITCKYLKKQGFSDTELTRLNASKLHIEQIAKIADNRDKATALKFYIIPKKAIFDIANRIISNKGYITTKELDTELQKVFITNSRKKYPNVTNGFNKNVI